MMHDNKENESVINLILWHTTTMNRWDSGAWDGVGRLTG